MNYFNVSEINKLYHKIPVLANVNISLKKGEMIWISGDNGSGKTTLCKIIAGLLPADTGNIIYENNDVKKMAAHQRMHNFLAYMPQESILLYDYSVQQNLEFTKELLGERIFTWSDKFLETMNLLFNVADFASQNTAKLSRGEKRKLEFYITLLTNSEIYLLDEPFSGLDLKSKKFMVKALEYLKKESKTIVVIEHDIPDELTKIIDKKLEL